MRRLQYQPELDGLRALAVMAVMGFHFLPGRVTGGSLGVDIFFVLSGYLVTRLIEAELQATGGIDFAGFLRRRARRLLPALIVVVGFYVLFAPVLFPASAPRRWLTAVEALTFVTNIRQSVWPVRSPLAHTWSLAVEGQFYLVFPFVMFALRRAPRYRVVLLLTAPWALLLLGRSWWALHYPGSPASYYATPFHATGLLIGAAVALAPAPPRWLAVPALAGLTALVFFGATRVTFLLAIPVAEVLAAVIIAAPPPGLAFEPLRRIGLISYGLYLWHIPAWVALSRWASPDRAIGAVAFSLLAASLSYVLVERPDLRRWLGRRLVPDASPS